MKPSKRKIKNSLYREKLFYAKIFYYCAKKFVSHYCHNDISVVVSSCRIVPLSFGVIIRLSGPPLKLSISWSSGMRGQACPKYL